MPIIRRLNEGLPPYFLVKKKVLSQIVYNNPTYSRPRSAVICARTAASIHSGAAKEEFGYQRGDLMGVHYHRHEADSGIPENLYCPEQALAAWAAEACAS